MEYVRTLTSHWQGEAKKKEYGEITIYNISYGKRLLNYIMCIRFFIEVHSIVSASQFSYTNLSQGRF